MPMRAPKAHGNRLRFLFAEALILPGAALVGPGVFHARHCLRGAAALPQDTRLTDELRRSCDAFPHELAMGIPLLMIGAVLALVVLRRLGTTGAGRMQRIGNGDEE